MKKTLFVAGFIALFVFISLSQKNDKSNTSVNDPIKEIIRRITILESQVNKLDRSLGVSTDGTNKRLSSFTQSLDSYKDEINEQIDALNSSLEEQDNNVNKKMSSLKDEIRLNFFPVGSIVAFGLEENKIPSGWVLCDGRRISDPNSVYYNKNVPDLVSSFIRGKGRTEALFAKGGTDEISDHRHTIPSHKHEVGNHTHSFTTNSASVSSYRYCSSYGYGIQCSQGGNMRYFLAGETETEFNNNSSHYHSGTTGNASSGYTQEGGGGSTSYSGAETNIPEYIALNYIIKIK